MKEKLQKKIIIQRNYTSHTAITCQRKLFSHEMTGYYRSRQAQIQQKRTISMRSS